MSIEGASIYEGNSPTEHTETSEAKVIREVENVINLMLMTTEPNIEIIKKMQELLSEARNRWKDNIQAKKKMQPKN